MLVAHYQDRISRQKLCRWLGLAQSSFYYQPKSGRRGRQSSTHTPLTDGSRVTNQVVVDTVRELLEDPLVCYGYQKMTDHLREQGYVINPKKVYRLLKENKLLLGITIHSTGPRKWVSQRKIDAQYPLDYLCHDIKYVWVEGEKRNYLLYSILDVYSRKLLYSLFQRSIRKADVVRAFMFIQRTYGLKGVKIRNDNGSQFVSHLVKQFLRDQQAEQEFTHVATPEENSYIEAYHSILERELLTRYEFDSYYDAQLAIDDFVTFYNERRLHGGIKNVTPNRKWDEGMKLRSEQPQNQSDWVANKAA